MMFSVNFLMYVQVLQAYSYFTLLSFVPAQANISLRAEGLLLLISFFLSQRCLTFILFTFTF